MKEQPSQGRNDKTLAESYMGMNGNGEERAWSELTQGEKTEVLVVGSHQSRSQEFTQLTEAAVPG